MLAHGTNAPAPARTSIVAPPTAPMSRECLRQRARDHISDNLPRHLHPRRPHQHPTSFVRPRRHLSAIPRLDLLFRQIRTQHRPIEKMHPNTQNPAHNPSASTPNQKYGAAGAAQTGKNPMNRGGICQFGHPYTFTPVLPAGKLTVTSRPTRRSCNSCSRRDRPPRTTSARAIIPLPAKSPGSPEWTYQTVVPKTPVIHHNALRYQRIELPPENTQNAPRGTLSRSATPGSFHEPRSHTTTH